MSSTSIAVQQKRNSISILTGQLASAIMKPKSEENTRAVNLLENEISLLQQDVASLLKLQAISERAGIDVPAPAPSVEDVSSAVRSTITSLSTANAPDLTSKRALMNAGFKRFIKGEQLTQEQRAIITPDTGAPLVAEQFVGELVKAMKYASPLLSLCSTKSYANGSPQKFSYVNDIENSINVFTQGTTPTAVYPTFGSAVVFHDDAAALLKVSWQLLADTATEFDIVDIIRKQAVPRLARGIEAAVTLGAVNSSGQLANNPGILNNATLAVAPVTATSIASTQSTTLTPYLVALLSAVDPGYTDAAFHMSSVTRGLILAIQTSTGATAYPELADMRQPTLLGRPVYLNQSLPSLATASALGAILYGSLSASTAIAIDDSPRINLSTETFSDTLEAALTVSYRFGSAPLIVANSSLVAFKQASA
jgi:HK97 family phage major capsid protein